MRASSLNSSNVTSGHHSRAEGDLPTRRAFGRFVAVGLCLSLLLSSPAWADGGGAVSNDVWLALIPNTIIACIGAYVVWQAQRSTTSRDETIKELQASLSDIRERYVRREEFAQLEARLQASVKQLRDDMDGRLDKVDEHLEKVGDKMDTQSEHFNELREKNAEISADLKNVARMIQGSLR